MTACLQFPESYPNYPILVELKSKTLSEKFLSGLSKVCEEECKKILGKPQVCCETNCKENSVHTFFLITYCFCCSKGITTLRVFCKIFLCIIIVDFIFNFIIHMHLQKIVYQFFKLIIVEKKKKKTCLNHLTSCSQPVSGTISGPYETFSCPLKAFK